MNGVKEYLKQWNLDSRIQKLEESSATVELAAKALHCGPERIAKTLSFKIGERYILIVISGDRKIDNIKYKETFQTRAKMLTPEENIEKIGHAIGGVCPFAIKEGVEVYLDCSLQRFQTVFPACGSSHSVIELSIPELEQCSQYKQWIDVCKQI